MIRMALCLILLATSALANPCPPPEGPEHRILRVDPDGTLVLDDRREILIAGVAQNSRHSSMADEVRGLTEGRTIRLAPSGMRPDRWGRSILHVWQGETLLAERLIRSGAALRAPGFGDEACARHLEALEPAPWPKLTRADLASENLGSVLRVEGKVMEARASGSRVYLKLDVSGAGRLTASLRDEDYKALSGGAEITGRVMRLRGNLEWWSEPVVVVAAALDAALGEGP
ncbi:hypothetical protein GCM10007276_31050 [Agaricicola taiwanensis]|uniref:Nuclease n=1 Tax=Agaricicola taiwanensis TaxID=591372 RepID=A0A8J2YM05_9RHOB|nr:hypothetical protein [Agaricicola taiwanensis]GGE51777.1 hypothetical protein GCM10007276_31050 [Agaricicola taiwanensis]